MQAWSTVGSSSSFNFCTSSSYWWLCDSYIRWCSVVKTMYSWLIIRCVVGEQIVVSVLWRCQVWDIVQQQLRAGSTVQWFSDRRSISVSSVSAIWLPPSSYWTWRLCNFDFCASLSLYGYVYTSGCVCIVGLLTNVFILYIRNTTNLL